MRLRILHSDELPLPRLVATIELVTCMVTPSAFNSRYWGSRTWSRQGCSDVKFPLSLRAFHKNRGTHKVVGVSQNIHLNRGVRDGLQVTGVVA